MVMLREFGMWECKPVATPMDPSKFEAPEEDYCRSKACRSWYAKVIGSLMYAMLGTRADIAYSVSVLSRYLANPTFAHVKGAKRIMRYLRGTYTMKLVFRGDL